jgi:hypothetical protein
MMTAPLRRALAWTALALTFAAAAQGPSKKSRVFDAGFERVWTAGLEVATEAFLMTDAPRHGGTLRFRTGPLRGYRFEVVVVDLGRGKTRVQVELRSNYYVTEPVGKDGWREGDRYLKLLGEKVQRATRK